MNGGAGGSKRVYQSDLPLTNCAPPVNGLADVLEAALQLAGRGWRVFPCHTPVAGGCSCGKTTCTDTGKHPRIKAWQVNAATDPDKIIAWWNKWPNANIGLATGGGLVVLDIDGREQYEILQGVIARYGPLPPCPVVKTGRGLHLYMSGTIGSSRKVDGLLIRGDGGYVIAPPSLHANGQHYQWIKQVALCPTPEWFNTWLQNDENKRQNSSSLAQTLGRRPDFLQRDQADIRKTSSSLSNSLGTAWTAAEEERIRSALLSISPDCERDTWLHIGMALHTLGWERPDGSDAGYEIWLQWSATAKTKYQGPYDLETRWRSFGKPGREQVTLGTLYHIAQQHGWQGLIPREAPAPFKEVISHKLPVEGSPEHNATPHSPIPPAGGAHVNGYKLPDTMTAVPLSESPLIELNAKYAVIGDVGGKCLVLGWTRSKIDERLELPSFQTFKSFSERYSNKYISVRVPKNDQWEEKTVQLGAQWLKWPQRTSYEAIDMVPNAPAILSNNTLNLWRGFAVEPKQGNWDLMKRHITTVLAGNNAEALTYILKWAAWKIQNPGERAEAALVFKGDKGSGKGTFANAIKRIFGPHGLQIFNSKHMTGQFNAHLRTCLLLYADEAFWAGDKQGESVLKGMLTEPTLLIEQKGVDATAWTNRLGIIMSANAEWVVPAGEKERRYAVLQVNGERAGDFAYFDALYHEMNNGGLAAMLYDLQRLKLGDWHPRNVPQTQALQEQKQRSFDPRFEWFESLISEGELPGAKKGDPTVSANILYEHFKAQSPDIRHCSRTAFGTFLRSLGCIKLHTAHGNVWQFKSLAEHREHWVKRFGHWDWSYRGAEWLAK